MRNENTLIFIPTYNESENVEKLYREIAHLDMSADVLFMDDNSPDGTGEILDRMAQEHSDVQVMHRNGKLGVGSAHLEGIHWAYSQKYKILITMDCDFTHSPQDIYKLVEYQKQFDIVISSRYLSKKSLAGWNIVRKFITNLSHFLTVIFLRMPYDATGAFRLYRLDRIPERIFDLVQSRGYSFFFESLYVLYINGFRVKEFPIVLPPRVYGNSKMTFKEIFASINRLVKTFFIALTDKKQVLLNEGRSTTVKYTSDRQSDWDMYWESKNHTRGYIYDKIAAFYRLFVVKRILNYFIGKYFKRGSDLLHAGCGSGQVDEDITRSQSITAMDISSSALQIYKINNDTNCHAIRGSIFAVPNKDNIYDGIYNLGVMEHFTEHEIHTILKEFKRVLKPEGKIVLFWPPEFGLSVTVLKGVHFILKRIFRMNIKLHPDEISRVRSKRHIQGIIEKAGLRMEDYYFGLKDIFTHVVVVARKL